MEGQRQKGRDAAFQSTHARGVRPLVPERNRFAASFNPRTHEACDSDSYKLNQINLLTDPNRLANQYLLNIFSNPQKSLISFHILIANLLGFLCMLRLAYYKIKVSSILRFLLLPKLSTRLFQLEPR